MVPQRLPECVVVGEALKMHYGLKVVAPQLLTRLVLQEQLAALEQWATAPVEFSRWVLTAL